MIISEELMNKMHEIQLNIFKEVIEVCNKLGITYYMVHGSLLGTVLHGKFMPMDDDIDIAMFRKDFERFIIEGSQIINERYFIQYQDTDKDYPLSFAKVRDNNTTYVADKLQNIKMNHGIFIDVFPIDYYEEETTKVYLKKKILNTRISSRYWKEDCKNKIKLKQLMACIIYPFWRVAIAKRNAMNRDLEKKNKIQITGGKKEEVGIDEELFSKYETKMFEGILVNIPIGYSRYLELIYGDYRCRTLLEDKEHDQKNVEINAIVFDLNQSYTNYLK